jgi:OOP family OmpA-OmpF porin
MSRSTLLILMLILWILLALFLCWKYFCPCCVAAGGAKETVAAAAATTAIAKPAEKVVMGQWLVNDSSTLNLKSNEHIKFMRSGFNHLAYNPTVDTLVNGTSKYLINNKNRKLLITGYYRQDEKNPSVLPNLGLARANDVKTYLIGKGVPGNQLDITSKMLTENWWANDTLLSGIDFSFSRLTNSNDKLNAIKSRLLGKPLTLYFETNQDSISVSSQQRQDFTDLIYYLDNVPSSKLLVSGHTDNKGDRNYNLQLSRERADFAKNYLAKNGSLGLNRMNVNGFGPDKPVGSNDTEQGRAQTRRVEITLQ